MKRYPHRSAFIIRIQRLSFSVQMVRYATKMEYSTGALAA
jgi:hypothetical protein